MAGLYDNTGFVPSWARARMAADGVQPYDGEPVAQPLPPVVSDYSNNESQIARGIRSAFSGAKASLQGFGGMGAELVGADEYAQQLYADAVASQQAAEAQAPRVRTIRQVMESDNPLSSGVDYLAGTVGQVAPYMLLSGAGALIGRGAGLAGGLRAGLSGEALAARAATGSGVGGTLAIHPVMAGDQAVQLHEDPAAAGMSVGERALRANVVGGLQSAANAIAPAAMVNQTFARGAQQALVPRILGNMALEGVGEGAEEVVNQAHRTTYDPTFQMDPELIGENAAAGFFGAAPIAGVHGVGTHTAHAGIDATVDGAKALGTGAQWVGEQAYKNMPPQVQQVADAVASGVQMTKDMADVLAPHMKNAAQAAKIVVGGFYEDAKENIKQYREDALADAPPRIEDVLSDLTENSLMAYEGGKHAAGVIADDIKNDPAIPDAIKAHIGGAKGKAEELVKTAEAFSDLSKWVGDNESMTAEKLQAIDSAAQQPQRLRRYAEEITAFIDETGQDTPAAQELRQYVARMAKGENLSADEVRNFWLKSRLAAEVERNAENLDALLNAKGVKMTKQNGKVTVENLSRQKDVVNKAVREALENATADKGLIAAVARRLQVRDVVEKGADRAVREAVGAVLAERGITPKANQTFTEMFNRVLGAVNEQVSALKEEGVIPSITPDDVPDAFKSDVRHIFTELMQTTDAGREMASSEAMVTRYVDGLTDYLAKLASGDLSEGAAVKLKHTLERVFGKEKDGVVDQTVERLVNAASAAFGGVDNDTAERVHALVNLNQTLAQKEVSIRRLIKFDVGEGRNLRGEIDNLLGEIERAREFDAKRSELPAAIVEAQKKLRELPQNSDEAYRLRGMLGRLHAAGLVGSKESKDGTRRYVVEDGVTGFRALKQKWVKEGIVSARNFDALVESLESYSGNPERLTRPEKRVASHETSANHAAEDENDFEAMQDSAATDEEAPVSNFDLDGKRTGDERQEYLEKRRRDKYGQDVTESKAAKPIYWGANAFEAGAHDAKTVSAPVSRHESGDRRKTSGAPGTEYNAMVDEAYAKYGHRVTDGHPVSVQRWAAEMADATGKSERQLMTEAMQALLAHDQKRLENPKTSEEDKKWIKARAELAERLGSRGDAGEKFFQNSINKNYSYYKMKPSDGTNLSYSRDYLERTAALRANGTHTDDVGVYVERMQKRHPGKFSDKVYERSLLELTTSDGKTITVDVPKLVREAMQRHQAAETKGLGEKGVESNLAEEIVTTFYNVMAALMTTDGIKEVGSLFESEDARGRVGTHFDPNLVIFVDPDGKMLQQGEHVLSHSVKRAFTLGDLTKIAGVDPETMRTKYKEQALFSDADLGTIVRSERRADKPNSRDELGVAVGGATQDGKRVSVDYHQLLARMLERNGIDPHQALQQETLPEKLAAALLREGLAELRARGIEGDAVDNAAAKFNNLVVYHKQYGEESYPVTLNQLRKHLTNEGLEVPRNLRDAKVQELVEKLEQADKLEKTLEERKARRALTLADKDGANAAVRKAMVDDAYDQSNFDYGTPEGQDRSGAKWRQKAEGSRIADGRVVNGTVINERERGDGPKFSQDEGENMRIQQILKELGEDAQGDTPLFDKTEAMGARYGGKEWVRQQRPVDEAEGEVRERPELPDYVASLRERLMEVAAKDPWTKKFLEDTFDMPFLEGDKMSKPFSKYMDERTAGINSRARTRNELTPNIVEAKKSAKPLTLAEQRANAKLTTETLGTVGHDEMRTTREDAAIKARADLRDNPTFGDKEDLDAYEAGAEKAAGAKATFEPEPAPKTEAKAEPKPAALDLTASGSRLEATRYLNSLDDAALKQVLTTLPAEPPAGSYAAHLRKELTKPAPVMQEWVDGILKRAGITADELGSRLPDAPFSRQRTVETPRAGAAKLDELTAEVDRLLGEGKVTLEMPFEVKDASGNGVSGKYDAQLKKILVSAVAADRMGTAWHETWHRVEDLLGDMGEHGKRVLDEVHKFVSTPMMKNWLASTYNGDEGVLGQLDTPSERAGFAFQMFMHGAKMPMANKTTFERVKGWVKKLFEKLGYGTTTNDERGKNFFQYVKDGGFARDVENAASVRAGLGEKRGDNLLRAAAETVKPVMEGLEKVFGHTSDRIRNLEVPEFTKILEAYSGEEGKGGIQLDMARNRLKFMNMVGDILGGKTPEEQYDIFAKDGLKTVLEGITKYLKDAGVPENTRLNMIHRVEAFNSELINDNFEGFVTDLVQHGGFKGKAGEARKIASTIVDRGYFYDPDIKLFENRADLAEKWMERGMLDKMMRYIDRATHVAEHTRAFGQVKEYETPEGRKYKQAEKLHDLLAAGDEKAKPEGRKLIRDFIAAQNGTLGGQMSPEMKKLFGGLLFVQNVHILPAMVFSQMLEPMQLALRKNSLSGSMDSLFRGIRDLPRAFKSREKDINRDYWEKLAYQVGSAPTRIINGVMQDLMNGITMGGTVGELNNKFFRFNGMEQWNRSMHVEATRHAVEFLREHKENVEQKKGDTDKNGGLRSERFLRELGVQASDIKFNGAGELILNDKVERAIVQWVEEAMAHPDAGSNPLWMNDPRWALISQMKRFTFANAKFVLGRGMKELKLGNAFPVAPAMLAMPWMMAADGLRDALTGSAGHQAKGALDYAQHAMERANLFGRGQFGLDTLDAVSRGGSPVEALGGPTVEMFGNIARGAHNGQLLDTLIDYSPAGGVINALS